MAKRTIGDIIARAEADRADATEKTRAAVAANQAATEAVGRSDASQKSEAAALFRTGPVFVQDGDAVVVYESRDGLTVNPITPKPASTPVDDEAPVDSAPAPGEPSPAPPADEHDHEHEPVDATAGVRVS